jgi:hypothetical protein
MTAIGRCLLGAVATLCVVPSLAVAGETASSRAVDAVEVRIGAVLASNSTVEVEDEQRQESMRKQFNRLFPYSSYRLVKEQRERVAWGSKVGFDIPGGRYVMVIPKDYKNERVSMKVVVIDGTRPIIDTSVSIQDRGTFLVGGPRQADGVLILSIGAVMVR